jgi:hypothetical protein
MGTHIVESFNNIILINYQENPMVNLLHLLLSVVKNKSIIFSLLIMSTHLYSQQYIYVDKYATGNNNGSSWANAFTGFNEFRTDTISVNSVILVATGVYNTDSYHIGNDKKALIWIKLSADVTIARGERDYTPATEEVIPNEVIFNGVTARDEPIFYGIYVGNPAMGATPEIEIEVSGIRFEGFYENGIKIRGKSTQLINRININYNKFYNMVGNENETVSSAAVHIQRAENIVITNNEIYQLNEDTEGQTDGIYLSDSCKNIRITENIIEIVNNKSLSHVDCIQIADDNTFSENVIIKNNRIYNNSPLDEDRQGIHVTGVLGYLYLINNTITSTEGNNLINIHFYAGTNTLKVYNNTLVSWGSPAHLINIEKVSGDTSSLRIKNNIFYKEQGPNLDALKFINVSSVSNNILNYNLYHNGEGTPKIRFENNSNNWNYSPSQYELNGREFDPLFEDTVKLTLHYNSPAKNKGMGLLNDSVKTDSRNNPRPYWNKDFDIGAYEVSDAQIKIGMINHSGQEPVTHSVQNLGVYWGRNLSGNWIISDDVALTNSNITIENSDTSNFDSWEGWKYGWINHEVDTLNKVAAGFYKISNSLHSSSYFYLDYRDAITGYSPNIYLLFDADDDEKKYSYFNGADFTEINNDEVIRVWDIQNSNFHFNALPEYWDSCLVGINKGSHPRLVWGPNNSSNDSVFILRKVGSYDFVHKDTLNVYEFVDDSITISNGQAGTTVRYKLKTKSSADSTNIVIYNVTFDDPYKIKEDGSRFNYSIAQNFPNPFNPTTTIQFSLAAEEFVTLKLYDILGREVTTLVNEQLKEGNHSILFNGSSIASGVYFYKITAGKFSSVKKLQVMK